MPIGEAIHFLIEIADCLRHILTETPPAGHIAFTREQTLTSQVDGNQ